MEQPTNNDSWRSDDRFAHFLAGTDTEPLHMLGIWAHPDDEAYLSAGLMARTVRAGGLVTVVALSDGEEGFPDDDGRPKSARASQRRSELRSAMAEIGVTDVRFLGVPDGAVDAADDEPLAERLAELIVSTGADVVVTFGPDGITGHPDHIANSRLATLAWMRAGRGELWYAAKTEAWLDEWREMHDSFGVWMTQEPTGVAHDDIELVIDLDPAETTQKRAVLAGHASQTDALAALFGEDVYRRWVAQETFRRPSAAELQAVRQDAPGRDAGLVLS